MRRFVEPRVDPRDAASIYLALLVGTALAVIGLLVFLLVFLSPHLLMIQLGIGCTHGDHCLHGLPTWAQFGLWMVPLALLGWLSWRVGRTTASLLCSDRRVRRLALTHGRRDREATGYTVYNVAAGSPLACTVGIFRPIIVVSSELRRSLSPEELAVVLAHERAHAGARDSLRLLLARVIDGALFFYPGVRQAHRGIRRSVEIAADAFAAKQTGDRLLVAGSLSRVASLVFESAATRLACEQPAIASFGHGDLVVDRVRHLLLDPRPVCRRQRLLCAMATLSLVFSIVGSSLYVVAADNLTASSKATVCADTSSM